VRKRERLFSHLLCTTNHHRGARTQDTTIGSQHDLRVKHRDERIKVAIARGGEKGVYHLSLACRIGVGNRSRSLHSATCPARELPRRRRGTPHNFGDLVEGHGEHIVQHEGEPLGGSQHFEHHEQRETDGVGEQGFVLGVDRILTAHDRIRHVHSQRLLAPQLARAQHV
jgi:hypothetical protein